jgi:rubrerythrin
MSNFKTIEEVLDFAMTGEQEAVDFYIHLADRTENSEMRDAFIQFAKEEMSHKARLLKIREEGIIPSHIVRVTDMKISDYLTEPVLKANMDYRDALVLAMSKEKAAFKLYTRLANEVTLAEMKDVFLGLAQEEAKHKLRFELEYDEFVLRDN